MSGSTLALRLADDVRAAAGGDRSAFHRLVVATRNTVASIAGAMVKDPTLAEDVAQDVYLSAWRDLPKLREATSFLPWIRQLTRNQAAMALRGRGRRRDRIEVVDPDDLLAAAADPRPDAMERLLEKERRAAVQAAVDALPRGSREVVLLYYREGESVRQVAELLDLSETAVKQRLYRARKRLEASLVNQVKETAPGPAFTAAVMGALTLGAPGAAAAAVVDAAQAGLAETGAAAKVGAAEAGAGQAGGSAAPVGLGLLQLPPGALAGAATGLAGAVAGIAFSARDLLRQARDDEERRGIWKFAAMNVMLTLGFLVVILAWPRPVPAFTAFGLMFVGFTWTHRVYLPRVVERRKAAERQEDPVAFARREAGERRARILGTTLGLLLGGGALALAFLL
jgi:RNA polymerase sigma factor (sigma-70 family)